MFILEKIGTVALTVQEQACTSCLIHSCFLCFVDQQHLPDCDVKVHQFLWALAVLKLVFVTGPR